MTVDRKNEAPEGEKAVLNRTFGKSEYGDDTEIAEDLWEDFKTYYYHLRGLRKKDRRIPYNAREFWLQGVPSPRQVVEWTNFIKMIEIENFNDPEFIPLTVNYLDNKVSLFKQKFEEFFAGSTDIEVTFVCGYFWKLYPERRDSMIEFVVTEMLKKGIKVNIWTQDKTLKKEFRKKQKKFASRRRPRIHWGLRRIDMHYTLIKNKKDITKSHVFMELPHTEAYEFRLETHFPVKQLNGLKQSHDCSVEKFMKFLKGHRSLTFAKMFQMVLSRFFNLALNTKFK
jgi:hypothetical protein